MCCAMAVSLHRGTLYYVFGGFCTFFFVFLYFIIIIVKMQYKRFECSSIESAIEEPVHILEGCGHNFVGLQVARSVMS